MTQFPARPDTENFEECVKWLLDLKIWIDENWPEGEHAGATTGPWKHAIRAHGVIEAMNTHWRPPREGAEILRPLLASTCNLLLERVFQIDPAAETKGWMADLRRAVPGLNQDVVSPCDSMSCFANFGRLDAIIIHLNDGHQWSREQIADWLDTLDLDLRFQTSEGGET